MLMTSTTPMFTTLAAFKRAAVIGSKWRKGVWRNGAWDYQEDQPHAHQRTVAKVQTGDLAFTCEWVDATEAQRRAVLAPKGLAWLGYPKASRWTSDGAGLIILYDNGTPNIRLDPA